MNHDGHKCKLTPVRVMAVHIFRPDLFSVCAHLSPVLQCPSCSAGMSDVKTHDGKGLVANEQGRNFVSLWKGSGSPKMARKGVKSEEKSDFIRILIVP